MALAGLVAYDGSSDEEEVESGDEQIDDASSIAPVGQLNLPSIKSSSSVVRSRTSVDVNEDVVDDTVKRKDWELKEAPKPPKRKQPVKIALPEMTAPDSDSDEESARPVPTASKHPKPGSTSSALLSMLPQPKSGSKADKTGLNSLRNPFLPAALSRKSIPTDMEPSKPKFLAKSLNLNSNARQNPVGQSALSAYVQEEAGKSGSGSDEEFEAEQEPNEEDLYYPVKGEQTAPRSSAASSGLDFLGLSSDRQKALGPDDELALLGPAPAVELDDEPAGPSLPTDYVHPSQMYNMAAVTDLPAPGPSYDGMASGRQYNDDEARRLIRRREAGVCELPPDDEDMPITDVRLDDKLGADVQAQLLRNITAATPYGPVGSKKDLEKEAKELGGAAKRKHQITYLAVMAKQAEEKLKEQWANNRQSRRQHALKYGF